MVSYWQIFLVFAKIGAFTIGGGYAMLPVIQNEITKRGWLKEEDFIDIMALAQAAPGLLAVNISIFTGHKLRGTGGSIAATLGSIMPSFLIILAVAEKVDIHVPFLNVPDLRLAVNDERLCRVVINKPAFLRHEPVVKFEGLPLGIQCSGAAAQIVQLGF